MNKWWNVLPALVIVFLLLGATQTSRIGERIDPLFKTLVIATEDVNDQTLTSADEIQGFIDDIVIDSNGTDTSFKVWLRDENEAIIWSHLTLTSASEPYHFAVSTVDGGAASIPYRGAAVDGKPQIQIDDCNNATMNALSIKIYYRDYLWSQ